MQDKESMARLAKAMAGQKCSIRSIARTLKIHRDSVKKLLGLSPGKTAHVRQPAPSMLDPFRERIRELAESTNKVNGRDASLTVKSIFRTIRKEGYRGGKTILEDFVREIRGTSKTRKAFARYEPPPGLESQTDWSPYRIPIGGREATIHVFSMILSYSRFQFLEAFLDEKQDTLFQGHIEAFRYFRGIPRKVIYDNQSPVVSVRIGNQPVLNERFEAFAGHYGFAPQLCLPYDKERKGRVERPFGYLEMDFFPGRKFADLADLRRQLRSWLEGEEDKTGNFRVHATTRRRPCDMWIEERDLLIALPQTDFLPTRIEERLVSKDCMVSVLGNHYTVPPRYVGKKVTVSITPVAIRVYDDARRLIAGHDIPEGKGRLVINDEHYAELRRARRHLPAQVCDSLFELLFPGQDAFLEGLKRRVKSVYPIHLKHLNSLTEHFSAAQVADAIAEAVSHSMFTSTYVEECLRRRFPSQISMRRFDEELEKPKGLELGPMELGDESVFDGIFPKDDNDSGEEDENGSVKV